MQIFTMRYNLEFLKLTPYGLTRPQCIRKSKQNSGQTILSSPQDLEFNPNFEKNRDKQRYTACHASHFTDRYALDKLLKGRLKADQNLSLSVNLLFSSIAAFSSDTTCSVPEIASRTFMFSFHRKMVYKQKKKI